MYRTVMERREREISKLEIGIGNKGLGRIFLKNKKKFFLNEMVTVTNFYFGNLLTKISALEAKPVQCFCNCNHRQPLIYPHTVRKLWRYELQVSFPPFFLCGIRTFLSCVGVFLAFSFPFSFLFFSQTSNNQTHSVFACPYPNYTAT